MAEIRQEQIVFGVALALVGALVLTRDAPPRPSRDRGAEAPDLVRFTSPDVASASLARGADDLRRALFSPPRDTRPLDPLGFQPPPLPPLRALAPAGPVGPSPRVYSRLLPTYPVVTEVEGLFDVSVDEFEPDGFSGGFGESSFGGDLDDETLGQLAQLGYLDVPGKGVVEKIESQFLDAEERRLREQTYMSLYDWIRRDGGADLQFGRIENEYPYGLRDADRRSEPIQFVEYEADRGVPRFPGSPPIEYERERLTDFQLARNDTNDLHQRFHDLPEQPTPASVEPMLALGADCIDLRLEVDGALEMAEDVYTRLAGFLTEDPRAGLGLARVFEAGFEFERAFEQYEALMERFGHRAEVRVGLARLEARFRLFDEAEARLRSAVAVERGSWLGHAALGSFLLERGDLVGAREALANAFTRLPQDPRLASERLRVRLDYGAVLVALGEVSTATEVYGDAWRADPESQEALAGLASCALLGNDEARLSLPDWLLDGDANLAEGFESLGFDLLLAGGLLAAEAGDLERALGDLAAALEADPLRVAEASCALSWVAERAGDRDESLNFAEMALSADPENVWALYQRGRLLLERFDTLEAAATFRRALELESDLEDALVGLGIADWREGNTGAAELYFERAMLLADERLARVALGADVAHLGADPRADVLGLRGINLLELGAFLRARDTFNAALAASPSDPVALGGRAWTIYRLGDVEEALIQLRSIDDALRARPEDDPVRVWSRERLAALAEHVAKDVWSDGFEYSTVGNGWRRKESAGPTAALRGGTLVLSGNFKTPSGEATFYRDYAASEFIAIEASIKVSADSNARAGIFVSREQGEGARRRVQAYAGVARSRDGVGQIKTEVPGISQTDWRDLSAQDFPFPADQWVRLRIERSGEGADTVVTIFMDGIPVLEDVPMTNLARGNSPLLIGLFAEGDTGRRVEVSMDDVEIVRIHGT
ncbi:tetratricopeptide repeat protein [Engelhardtia mirabilis]|uniref:Cellulose synthase subunit BcsC n=1 Tax=Engelhardtia mirabilis TaxID=2528011 RepID=A0A518BQ26_9BACT|nr:cellulose synthase subunit BcsC [Planctomycetes bacterium Pla133]QDV03401.1 cellulose synthase subunit BcsC [Planctomycetes bacterium Pla86]